MREDIQRENIGSQGAASELERMLDALREGDTVVITELTRLGRSVKELFTIIERVHDAGASIKSLRETWLDTTTPQGNLLFTIFAGLSQFERDLIRQRTKDGLEAARAERAQRGRPKASYDKVETALKMYESKLHTIEEITYAHRNKPILALPSNHRKVQNK